MRRRVEDGESALIQWMKTTLELQRDERLHALELEWMRPGPGARSYLFAASKGRRRYVIKLRRDAEDTAEREAWALRRLRGTIAPRLVAWWPGDEHGRRAGGCIVMSRVPGEVPDVRQVVLAARTIARLHAQTPRRGAGLSCPSSHGALLRYAADLLARTRRLSRSQRVELGKALRARAERRVPAVPTVRALCHGDLEWHNMRHHGEQLRLLDFEAAGIGDPAVDLMLMAARSLLSRDEVDELLSNYLAHRPDQTLRARCALVGPLVGVVSALSATLSSSEGAPAELEWAMARARVTRQRRAR